MRVTLSELDKLVKEGKILEAFDTYFSDDVVTYDESGNKTTSKAEKRALLEGFFNEFAKTEFHFSTALSMATLPTPTSGLFSARIPAKDSNGMR